MTLKRIDNEQLLLKQISEGDEQAFGVLFYHYLPVLQAFALRFTKSDSAAEEIIQDTFLRVWLNRDKLESVENVKAWLYKYTSSECLSYLRKVLKQARAMDDLKKEEFFENNNTSDTIHLNEVSELVRKAVDKLPQQRKRIYEMSRNEGLTIPQIAEILHLSPNTVKNALVTSLKSIREYLKNHGVTLSLLTYLALLK